MKQPNPNNWKKFYHKKTITDYVIDLYDDIANHLGHNKHIQNIKNFFKKFKSSKIEYKEEYFELSKERMEGVE